jgi:hypothetical protein
VACDAPTDVGLGGDKLAWPDFSETKEGSGRTKDAGKLMVPDVAVYAVTVTPEPVIVGTLAPDEDTMISVNVDVAPPCTTDVTIWVEVTPGALLEPGEMLESAGLGLGAEAGAAGVDVGVDGGG